MTKTKEECFADKINVRLVFIGQRYIVPPAATETIKVGSPEVDFWMQHEEGLWQHYLYQIERHKEMLMSISMHLLYTNLVPLRALVKEMKTATHRDGYASECPEGKEMSLTQLLDMVRDWGTVTIDKTTSPPAGESPSIKAEAVADPAASGEEA